MPVDNRWLEKRHLAWYAVVTVPPAVRQTLGKRKILRSLKTRDVEVARARRWGVVKELKAEIEAAKSGRSTGPRSPLTEEAMTWRATLAEADDEYGEVIGSVLADRAAQIETKAGLEAAREFHAIASGQRTPVDTYLDQWFAETSFSERTLGDHRHSLKRLQEWAEKEGVVLSIEGIDRKLAGRFVSGGLVARRLAVATANKAISSLSTYWRWLMKRGLVEANPWERQSLARPQAHRTGDEARERPFTDTEVATLVSGEADPVLADFMRIAVLSGMRIEEIARLRVQDCVDNALRVTKAKTRAGIRAVPTHPDLVAIVAGRSAGKAPEDYLFHEMTDGGREGERSMAVSKRFGYYRKRVGIHELPDGKRRSLVNFHSFRRWFITKAEQAGQPLPTIEAVVGHARQGMSAGVYSAGPSEGQLRGCVEAVRLP